MPHRARNKLSAKGMDMNDMVTDRSWDSGFERARGDEEQPLMTNGGDVENPGQGYSARLLYKKPAETLKWLEQCGVKKLGDFMVRDNTVLQLLDRDGMLTLGTEEKDLDWEAMWKAELARDDHKQANERVAAMEVEAFVVDVEGAADADMAGLINPLLHCFQNCVFNVNVWALPAVEATITFKWKAWARKLLFVELGFYLTWLLAFQAFALMFQDEDDTLSLGQLVKTPRGIVTVIFEIISTLGMLPFIYIEVCTLIEYGPWGWLDFWNTVDIGAYALQIAIVAMHLSRTQLKSNELSIIMAIQVLLLWIKVQYYARVLQPTKNPFIDTLKAVLNDVKWFLFLLLVTMFGFSVAFNILYRRDQQKEQFRTIGSSFTTCFDWLMGGVDFTIFQDTHNPQVGVVLLLLYWFSLSMVLLNCLIAIMADACTRVSENRAARFMAGRAEIIDELEGSLPGWLRKHRMHGCYPRYIHFLKVNKRSADPSMSDTDTAAKEDEATGRLDDLEAQINRISAIQEALAKKLLDKKAYDALPPLNMPDNDGD